MFVLAILIGLLIFISVMREAAASRLLVPALLILASWLLFSAALRTSSEPQRTHQMQSPAPR